MHVAAGDDHCDGRVGGSSFACFFVADGALDPSTQKDDPAHAIGPENWREIQRLVAWLFQYPRSTQSPVLLVCWFAGLLPCDFGNNVTRRRSHILLLVGRAW